MPWHGHGRPRVRADACERSGLRSTGVVGHMASFSAKPSPAAAFPMRRGPHPMQSTRAPNATPSRRSPARAATISAAAAFSSTVSRYGPVAPCSKACIVAAFSAASPPRIASIGARGRPASSGVTVKQRTEPSFFKAATRFSPATVSSSSPWPCTIHAVSLPSRPSVAAIGCAHLGRTRRSAADAPERGWPTARAD